MGERDGDMKEGQVRVKDRATMCLKRLVKACLGLIAQMRMRGRVAEAVGPVQSFVIFDNVPSVDTVDNSCSLAYVLGTRTTAGEVVDIARDIDTDNHDMAGADEGTAEKACIGHYGPVCHLKGGLQVAPAARLAGSWPSPKTSPSGLLFLPESCR